MQKAIGILCLVLALTWVILRPSLSLVNVAGFVLLFAGGASMFFGFGGFFQVPAIVESRRKNHHSQKKVLEIPQQRFRFDGNPTVKLLLFVFCLAVGAVGLTILAMSITDTKSGTWVLGLLFAVVGGKLAILVKTFYKVQVAADNDGLTILSLFKKMTVSWNDVIYLDKKTLSSSNEMRCLFTVHDSVKYCGDAETIGKFDAIVDQALTESSEK